MPKSEVLALCVLTAVLPSLHAQAANGEPFRNELEISQTAIHFRANQDYLGAGLAYRRTIRPWLGFEAEASLFPQRQAVGDDKSYGELVQFLGAGLLGHRWRYVSLFGEGGIGTVRSHAYGGLNAQSQPIDAFRSYKDVVAGALLDIRAGRRMSLTFECRDNIDFVGAFSEYNSATNYVLIDPASILHSAEFRMGVAFKF